MSESYKASEAGYGAEAWRQPTLQPGDTLIFNECGRVMYGACRALGGTDYRSHCYSLIRDKGGDLLIGEHHGGGEARIYLSGFPARLASAFDGLDSDQRYMLLHSIAGTIGRERDAATEATARKYSKAFVEGRLKRRRKNNRIYVDIIAPAVIVAAPAEAA